MTELTPIARVQMVDAVVEQIRQQIVEGKLGRGKRVPPELELAERLSVSRNTVREAMRILEAEGWVQRSKRGTTVIEKDANLLAAPLANLARLEGIDAHQLFEVRLVIEAEMAAMAAARATERDRARVSEALAHLEADQTQEGFLNANFDFHRAIAIGSGNQVLMAILDAIKTHLLTEQFAGPADVQTRKASNEGHREIAKAILTADVEGARQAMRQHLKAIEDRY
ncbi:MAG TPA: FCD domain-containing protein [Symbiobacteriaceae bacterium]|nr:FCD domain-containing protein [Symbiobacteriaceae bacterium]